MPGEAKAFFSYSRQDSEFAIRLAKDLRGRGAAIWIDQLDIVPGTHWDESVEKAVDACSTFLVLLSPNSTESENVMDEVAYALDEKKAIVPVMFSDCKVPLRLRRMQYVDVRASYETGVQEILKALHVAQRTTDIQSAAQRVQAEQAARDIAQKKAQTDAAAQAQLAQQQAQQQEQARVLQEQAQATRMAQLERERQFAVAQQPPPPLSALMPAMPKKNRKLLWIVLGVAGAFLLIGGIISAINDNDSKARERGYFPPAQDAGAAVPSAPGPVVQQPAEQQSVEQPAVANSANEQALLNWLNGLIQVSEGPTVANLLPYYSSTVTPYFGFPTAQWPQIAADKQMYFNRFPQVQYQLVAWRHTPRPDGSEDVYYSVRYKAVRQDGFVAQGTSYVWMVIGLENGQWKITGIQERAHP
jgi:TIR domain